MSSQDLPSRNHCASIIQDYLSSGQDADKTASALTDALTSSSPSTAISPDTLMPIWQPIIEAAAANPPSQDKIIALLRVIQDRGIIRNKDNEPLTAQGSDDRLWYDLPLFDKALHDALRGAAPPKMQLQRWTALHEFAAKVTGAPLADGKLCALWALREALEEDRPLTRRAPEAADEGEEGEVESVVSVDALLPAAVAYLEHCPTLVAVWSLRSHVFERGEDDGLGARCREEGIAKNGYSVRRWRIWRGRLEEIAAARDEAGGREKVAKVAYKALQEMEAQDREVMIAYEDLKSLHDLDRERWGYSALHESRDK